MRVGIPPRPSPEGGAMSPECYFMQRVWDACFGDEGQFIDTPTVKVEATSRGIAFHSSPRRGRGGEPVTIKLATLVSVNLNELACIDPDTPGTTIRIAKPYKLRQHASQVIDSTTLTYTYISAVERNAFQSGVFLENQIILPRYQAGDPIFYAEIEGEVISGVNKIDINVDARAWARRFV